MTSESIWEAAPHTIAKIVILEKYLTAWFQILGRTRKKQDLWYIDGFAGPGKYLNYPKGSPVAALAAARSSLLSSKQNWIAQDIRCSFIESDEGRFNSLSQEIKDFENEEKLKFNAINETFVNGLTQIQAEANSPFRLRFPIFVFIDPCGATGVPFKIVSNILAQPTAEILLNFDADGIARIYAAKESANHESILNEIFGDDSWKHRLSIVNSFGKQCREVLALYKEKLRQLKGIRYVFAFEMRTKLNSLNYFLVFASQHPLGLEKMKEAMKAVDQSGEYCFSDARIDQELLFSFNDPSIYAESLHHAFVGRQVSYADCNDFALNETPFLNPKSMLKILEEKGIVTIISNDPKRRKGTFNEEKVLAIHFDNQ
ncbi:three-Cys-motif partner protein TcmP [Sphingobacteriales bacterium CHB3]|nr:three-Cys-motif partner protein TcmP [Sphingobacteriales bacterium CHB3]